jgi:pimeloyl-ACP methyl ester carboxylesterase
VIHASTPAFPVRSAGFDLPGVLHLPAGSGPHPAVLLLHGFPGYERNFDLAQTLRSAGYAVLVFHYRGSWGASGSWSWSNVLADAAAAVRALRDTDIQSLSIVGHSLGGFAALQTAAADPTIDKVVSITCFDLGVEILDKQRYVEAFGAQLLPLSGTSAAALVDEMVAHGPDWRLAVLGPKLADRPVLLIGGSRDDDAPYEQHHLPLIEAYREARLEHHLFDTDHCLSDHREELSRTVLEFLRG